MSILIDPHDPRGPKAVALATQALTAGWPHLRAFYVPSSTDPTSVYVTTRAFCTCPDYRYRGPIRRCFHSLAIELLDQLADETPAF